METNSGLRAYLNISFVQGMGRNQKELIRNWPRNFRFFYQQNSPDKAIIDDRAQKNVRNSLRTRNSDEFTRNL